MSTSHAFVEGRAAGPPGAHAPGSASEYQSASLEGGHRQSEKIRRISVPPLIFNGGPIKMSAWLGTLHRRAASRSVHRGID